MENGKLHPELEILTSQEGAVTDLSWAVSLSLYLFHILLVSKSRDDTVALLVQPDCVCVCKIPS